MPYKDPEKRKQANRAYAERKAAEKGRLLFDKAGAQKKIARCEKCPEKGAPCRDCYNAHRKTYRVKHAGYNPVIKPRASMTKKRAPKTFKHRIQVVLKPVEKFLNDDLFSCPGCQRKLRGEWRFCDRCEARRRDV